MTNISHLQRYCQADFEIYVDHSTGETATSVKGYARLSGKAQSTISERLKGVRKSSRKVAQMETAGGIQKIALIDEELITEWLPKDNPGMATKFLRLGLRFGLQKMAGYKPKPTPQPQLVSPYEGWSTKDLADAIKPFCLISGTEERVLADFKRRSRFESVDALTLGAN